MKRVKITRKNAAARRVFVIDGVRVPQRVYFRRQQFGEYPGAYLQIVDIQPKVRRER